MINFESILKAQKRKNILLSAVTYTYLHVN